jgi:hypothetical protein
MEVRTRMFVNRNESLSDEPTSLEAVDGILTAFECGAPLLLMPFWTGLPEGRPVTGLTDDLDHAEGLMRER